GLSPQTLTLPVSGKWAGAWGGRTATPQPVLPVKQVWVMLCKGNGLPLTGTVLLDDVSATGDNLGDFHLVSTRRAIPVVPGPTSAMFNGSTPWVYYPDEVTAGELHASLGYNGLGEGPCDLRDLRVAWKNTQVLAFWGRIGLTGSTQYYNPVDIKAQTATVHGHTVWQWGNTDSRTGLQHVCRTSFDKDGITSTIYLRFRKAHDGKILLPFCPPQNVPTAFLGGTGMPDDTYGFASPIARTSRVEYTLGTRKLVFLFAASQPQGVTFTTGDTHWTQVLRGSRTFSKLEIAPPDGKTFPAGYTNAIQLRMTWDTQAVHPKSIEACTWDSGINLSFMEKGDNGQWSIPQAPSTRYFLPGDAQQLAVTLDNLSESKARTVSLTWTVRDYSGHVVQTTTTPVRLSAAAQQSEMLPLHLSQHGIYTVTCSASEGTQVVQQRVARFTVLPQPTTIAGEQSYFGIDPVFFPGSEQDMTLLRAFGMRLVRLGGGVWSGGLDYLKRLRAHDIDYFLLIGGQNNIMANAGEYGTKWEIINEPDAKWQAEKYAEEVRLTREKIKSLYPNATILACDVSGGDSDSDFAFTKAFLKAGGGKSTDIIPFHPYSSIRIFGPGLHPVSPEDNQLLAKLQKAQQLTKDNNVRMWIGEIGYMMQSIERFPRPEFLDDERMMANYLVRLYLIGRCIPHNERIVWFQLCKDETPLVLDPAVMMSYSLLDVDNNVTPAMVAYANLASLTDGATFVKKIDFPMASLYGVLQQRAGENILALWAVNNASRLTFASTQPVRCVSIVGTESTLSPVNGKITLNLSDEPCYLIFPTSRTALVEHIEHAAISVVEPVQIATFNIANGTQLTARLRNRTPQALAARVTLAYPKYQETWTVTLAAGEEKNVVYPLKYPLTGSGNIAATLTVEAGGGKATAHKTVTAPRVTPDLIAIRTKTAPVIDGKLDEWAPAMPIVLNKHELVSPPDPGFWKGPDDLSATGYVMYDETHLYFACRVKDDVERNDNGAGRIWAGDSIQIGFGNMEIPDAYTEIGIGRSSIDGVVTFMNSGVNQGKAVAGAQLAMTRENGETIYEAAIPFSALKGIFLYPGCLLRFAFIINDVDSYARKWIAVKDASLIGGSKDPAMFPALQLKP
ncbi:MAG TPA: sugar-binding protein, partial [Armatimonadota bacterium]|nr:sugar-binding protein [Armatimonadota bacterium]